MERNAELKYIGKGFMGYDPKDPKMVFIEKVSFNSLKVKYKDFEMIVSPHEVKK